MTAEITALILTYNEAPNLKRTLDRLGSVKEIVVVDSYSTDDTLDIARSFPQVRIVQREFDSHTAQWNFGLEECRSEWVLSLDADYILTPELEAELFDFQPRSGAMAYRARFAYCINGRTLRGTLYPPRVVLFRKNCARYVQDGHTQILRVDGPIDRLQGKILHDDRKPLTHWLWAQDRYAQLEVQKLLARPISELRLQDRLRRRLVFAPAVVFFYTLFFKGLILDGWPGWFYVLQRTYTELLLSLRLLEAKLFDGRKPGEPRETRKTRNGTEPSCEPSSAID
jgi:glycosyltransferase involved in cell wall biosynthesis